MTKLNERAPVNDTLKMSLLCEVRGVCPLCKRSLIKREAGKVTRVFDVAHIYPFNVTPRDLELLKGEEVLSVDVDCEANFLALCKECHKVYDTNKTVDEYRRLVGIKKTINKMKELADGWGGQTLHSDISKVAAEIGQLSREAIKGTELSFDALTLGDKKDSSLSVVNEFKIEGCIVNFYIPIRESLKKLEFEGRASTKFICSQVKSYYLLLLMSEFGQDEVFERMSQWFMLKTGINDLGKSEALVSYFIQNCEIFSDDNAK